MSFLLLNRVNIERYNPCKQKFPGALNNFEEYKEIPKLENLKIDAPSCQLHLLPFISGEPEMPLHLGLPLILFPAGQNPHALGDPVPGVWEAGRQPTAGLGGVWCSLWVFKEAASLTTPQPQPLSPTKSLPLLGFRLQSSRVGKTPEWSFSRQRTPPRTLSWALTPVPRLSRPVEEVFPPRSELR